MNLYNYQFYIENKNNRIIFFSRYKNIVLTLTFFDQIPLFLG